jgi:hypothetical protein
MPWIKKEEQRLWRESRILPPRVAGRINKTEKCWEWNGNLTAKGYAQARIDMKMYRVHKLLYEIKYGPVPEGMELDHTCRNKKCVNPDHLEAVTHAENLDRHFSLFCRKGHPRTSINTAISGQGWRYCLDCESIRTTKDG